MDHQTIIKNIESQTAMLSGFKQTPNIKQAITSLNNAKIWIKKDLEPAKKEEPETVGKETKEGKPDK